MITLARSVTALNRLLFTAAKWLVYVIVLLMLWEVLSRYLLAAPTSWAPELATLIFGPFFLLGGPYLLHLGGHVAVDVGRDDRRGKGELESGGVVDVVHTTVVPDGGVCCQGGSEDDAEHG